MKKFGLIIFVLSIVVFIYQSGENKSARKVQKQAGKVANAGEEVYKETKEVLGKTAEAFYLPQAKKKFQEYSSKEK